MKHWKKYFIVAGFLALLIVIQFRNPEISGPFKGIAGNVLNPFVYLANRIGVAASDLWSNYIWLVGVADENKELLRQLDELTFEYSILSEKVIQLEKLSKLIDVNDTFAFTTTAANVISRNVDGYVKSIIIDRGSSDGISVNDPVVSVNGLVGRVSIVYHSSSQVDLLYHHDSSVSVLNSRTRAIGIVQGNGHGGLFVDYYDRLDDVHIGDVFITSGMGKLYPKGIKVGVVDSISTPSAGLFQEISMASSVNFYKLEQVLVVSYDRQMMQDIEME